MPSKDNLRQKIAKQFPFNTFKGTTLEQLIEATVAIVEEAERAEFDNVNATNYKWRKLIESKKQ